MQLLKLRYKALLLIVLTGMFLGNSTGAVASADKYKTITIDSYGYVGNHDSMAIRSNGLPVMSYYDASNHKIKLALCLDVKCSSVVARTVATVDSNGTRTAVTILPGDLPLIAYSSYTSARGDGYVLAAKCIDTDCSSFSTSVVAQIGSSSMDNNPLLAVSADVPLDIITTTNGVPLVVFGVAAQSSSATSAATRVVLATAQCNDDGCFWGSESVVSGNNIKAVAVTLDENNLPVIAYQTFTFEGAGELKLAHCLVVDCSELTTSSIQYTGSSSAYPDIVLGTDHLPVISYFDPLNKRVHLARCADIECSLPQTISIASSKKVVGTSIALNQKGKPIIAFATKNPLPRSSDNDVAKYKLQLANCMNTACTRYTKTVVAKAHAMFYPSLVLGSNNKLLISYYDAANYDLKLARQI